MDVTIQLYAALAQIAETRELTIDLDPPADGPFTVADLMNHLKQHYPNWAPARLIQPTLNFFHDQPK